MWYSTIHSGTSGKQDSILCSVDVCVAFDSSIYDFVKQKSQKAAMARYTVFFHNMYRRFVLYNIYRVHSSLGLSAVSIRKDINE